MQQFTYEIDGQEVLTDRELSEAEIEEIAADLRGSSVSAPSPSASPRQVLPDFLWNRMSDEQKRQYERTLSPSYERGEGSGSFIAGIEDLPLGAAQLGANIIGQGEGANQAMRQREAQIQAGREQEGRGDGWDWQRILGGVASPINIGIDKLMRLPTAVASPWKTSAAVGGGLAATQPVAGEDTEGFWGTKITQVAVGTVLGPVSKAAIDSVAKIGSLATSFTGTGRQQAMREWVDKMAGPERDEVIKALQDAQEFVKGSRPTVAEVLSDLPSAIDLVRKQAQLASKPGLSAQFQQRAVDNQAARVRELQSISGTEAQRTRLAAQRDASTGATREAALGQADEARLALGALDKQANDEAARLIRSNRELFPDLDVDERFVDVLPTSPADLTRQVVQRTRALKDTQLKMLEQTGTYPIYAKDLLSDLDARIAAEGTDIGKSALKGIRDKIASKADENGILSSRDLYDNVRKTINDDIATLLNQGDKYASGGLPQQAAKAAADIRSAIDGSINKTSNGLWSKYLTDYKRYSSKLNRMEVGQYLVDKLQQRGVSEGDIGLNSERLGAFAGAVENAAGTIKRSTGQPRFEKLGDVLTPKEVQSVRSVLNDLARQQKAARMGSGEATKAGVADVAGIQPGFFSAALTTVRAVLSSIQEKNNARFNKELSALLVDPSKMAQFMSSLEPRQASTMGRIFYDMADTNNRTLLTTLFTVPDTARSVDRPEEF